MVFAIVSIAEGWMADINDLATMPLALKYDTLFIKLVS